MSKFLKFTDPEGDPIYVLNDITAIYLKAERTTIANLHGPVRTHKAEEGRGIVSASSGGWIVSESFDEILTQIREADREDNRD